MTEFWFRSLDDIDGGDLGIVGHKSFNLALMRRSGITVLPGMVVTTQAFEAQIKHLALTPLWAGSTDVAVTESAVLFLADTLKTKPLARSLNEALLAAVNAQFPPETSLFVTRSSAIDEDEQDRSFAGIHLTELDVPRAALPISLTRCWASALGETALRYRQRCGLPIRAIKIAVLIQPMLQPDAAGVGFTLNPTTGARDELVIEASHGSGAALVRGRMKPDRYRLAKRAPLYPIIGHDAAGRANTEHRKIPPLSEPRLQDMARVFEQIEALLGQPQDVEWAWLDDRFYTLQTRPAQVMPEVELPHVDVEWTRGNYRETLPELPSPLFVSLLERTQDRARSFLDKMGLDPHGVGPYLKVFYGRPFLNLTLLKRVMGQVGLVSRGFLEACGYVRPEPARRESWSIDWSAMWRSRKILWRVLANGLRAAQPVSRYEADVHDLSKTLLPKAGDLDAEKMLAQFRVREQLQADMLNLTVILVTGIAGSLTVAARLLAPFSASPFELVNALATLGTSTVVTRRNRLLLELGRAARLEPKVARYLVECRGSFANYRTKLAGTDFLIRFEALLVEEGYRAVYEADMGCPRFRDDPTPLLQIIRRYVRAEKLASASEVLKRQVETNDPLWRSLTAGMTIISGLMPWRLLLARLLIGRLRILLNLRERLHTAHSRAWAAIRQWDLGLAQHWLEAGWLHETDEYFWLTMEEIEQTIMTGAATGLMLRPSVKARQATYETYRTTEVPHVLHDSEVPRLSQLPGAVTQPLAGVLVGLPLSPGQVEGRVMVLRHPEDLFQPVENTILVTPSTDPAWFPLFPLVSGLIVEIGGLLSHGSIIAREFGLTAVANIPDAMDRLKTGDRVFVDGSTGLVQILERIGTDSQVASSK